MRIYTKFYLAICSLFLVAMIIGCKNENPIQSDVLTPKEKEQIELEVRQRVDDYFEDVQSRDIKGTLSFWSNSEDFIHAGDGSIFGNYDKWSNWLLDRYKKGTVEKYLYWENSDIHVIVLSKDVAAYTMNFKNAFIENGETRKVTGSWTYVMRKSELGWQVVVSNGTHIGLSYDE